MSRSDGIFPEYKELKLDEETWPKDYWDHALVCNECGTAWPVVTDYFSPSVCCQAKTIYRSPYTPDMRWPDAVKEAKRMYFERLYDIWNEGKSDVELEWEELYSGKELDDLKVRAVIEEFIRSSK